MSRLFGRDVRVTVLPSGREGVEIRGLRMEFDVEKTSTSAPNSLNLKIYNLSDKTVSSINRRDYSLRLEAGYQESIALLYAGDVQTVIDEWQPPDRLTTLECGDGHSVLRTSTLFESFAAGTSARTIFERVANAMNVPLGEVRGVDDRQYVSGFSAAGSARTVLDTLCRRLKVRWSILDGVLVVLPLGEATREEIVVLSPDTGLIGSPERTDEGLRFRSLLNPKLNPGRRVRIESRSLTGEVVARKVRHSGDTHGDKWETEVESGDLRS